MWREHNRRDGTPRRRGYRRTAARRVRHTTSVQDRAAFPAPIRKRKRACRTAEHVWPGGGYIGPTGAQAAAKHGVTIEIPGAPKAPSGGSKVQPRRWVVGRTSGWIDHNRRLVRQYE